MSLKPVYEMLEHLASISANKERGVQLKEYLKDPLFLKVVQYALDTSMTFKVKKFPEFAGGNGLQTNPSKIFEYLDILDSQPGASLEDKKYLYNLASIDAETYEVVRRICNSDLRCGCSLKSVNKARPGTIFYVPYMRCHTDKKISGIDFSNGAYIQEKADGMFDTMDIIGDHTVLFYTRDGKQPKQLDILKNIILDYVKTHDEWTDIAGMGEFRILEEDGVTLMDRQTGNGILNSMIYGTADKKYESRVVFSMWDMVDRDAFWAGQGVLIYDDRLDDTTAFVEGLNHPMVQVIESHLVYSLEEAQNFYARMRKEGKEGAILKNRKGLFKDHTSPNQIKMKNVSDASLRIIGWKEGNGKYVGKVGSILCATECGKCEVSLSGMSDEEREWDMDEMMGVIVDAEFESVIKSKNKELYSLYLPRYVGPPRFDRSTADTLEDLLTR